MTVSRFARIEELFQRAAELEPAERESFLAQLSPADAELRDELAELLAADQETAAEAELRRRVQAARDLPEGQTFERTPSSAGDRIGPYRILRELGRGGLGTVFLAERDDREFSRRVALKVVRPGMESESVLERLRRERQILAELDHPNIARLFDGGATAEGLPYFAMEVIEGERIDAFCRSRGTPLRQRIEMLRKVCDAVHYAHRKLVLHRDLKPSNILVGENGEPKLLDFGIAKVLGTEGEAPASILAETPTLTETGHLLLTPEFASPEQVRGESLSTASDVYSLGVILYQLVTGNRPYEFDRRRFAEVERVICQVEPVRASEMARRFPELAAPGWEPAARGDDLDNILAMALRKEPERRYLSAAELAEDLRRYLEDLPVSARADTTGYRLRKFTRRHRWGVAAGAAILVLLLATVVLTTWQARIARQERARAEGVANFLLEVFRVSDPYETLGNQISAREILDRGATRMKNDPGLSPDLRADLLETMGKVYFNLSVYEPATGLLEEARQIRLESAGSGSPEHLEVLLALSRAELQRRSFAKAEALTAEVLKLTPDLETRVEAQRLKSEALLGMDQLEPAAELLEKTLALAAKAPPLAQAEVLESLGDMWLDRQQPARAQPFYEKALAIRQERAKGPDALVVSSQNDLALALHGQGKLAEAERHFREILTVHGGALGERHTIVWSARVNLANARLWQRDPAEAQRLLETALAQGKAIFGPGHPAVADVLIGLARCSQMRATLAGREGRADDQRAHLTEASRLAGEALAIDRKALGEDHSQSLRDRFLLAELAAARKDAAAERLFLEIAERLRAIAPGDPRLATALIAVGKERLAQGRALEAETVLREGLAMLEADARPTLEARVRLATSLEMQGRMAEALKLAEETLADFEARKSPSSSPLEESLRALLARLADR